MDQSEWRWTAIFYCGMFHSETDRWYIYRTDLNIDQSKVPKDQHDTLETGMIALLKCRFYLSFKILNAPKITSYAFS